MLGSSAWTKADAGSRRFGGPDVTHTRDEHPTVSDRFPRCRHVPLEKADRFGGELAKMPAVRSSALCRKSGVYMDLGPYQLIKKLADGFVGPILLCADRQAQGRFVVQPLPAIRDARWLRQLEELASKVARSEPLHGGSTPLIKLSEGRYLWVSPVPSGQSFAEVLAACAGRRCGDGLQILITLAEQLARWQNHGVCHLALQPALIYVNWNHDPQGRSEVRVLGSGLASTLRLFRPIADHAAFAYLAPEQRSDATEQKIDGAADIYSLGVLLIQVLLGVSADALNVSRQMGAYLDTLHRQDVAPELLRLLRRMLAHRPLERPTLQEVIATLRTVVEEEQEDETVLQSRLRPSELQAPVQPVPQAVPDADEKVGLLCGNFRILRKLGEGGMGVVYEAEHCQIGKRAAVKIMHPEFAENSEFATRFLNEARAVNIIRHPGLVEIFEYGQLPDGTLFIVMEFLEGQTLFERFLKSAKQSPLLPTLQISCQVAQALAAAHDKNIVHRDLKPENIMLIDDPVHPDELRVKVLDFGIAKIARRSAPNSAKRTGIGSYMGTPLYMAPEQHGRAEEVDGRADVFAFGVILHEMLAGKSPFQGSAISLLGKPAPSLSSLRSDLPPGLSELVQRMMSLESAQRPTMTEIVETLSGYVHKPKPQLPSSIASRLVIGTTIGLCILLAGFLLVRALRPVTPADARVKALAVVTNSLQSSDEAERVWALSAIAESKDSSLRNYVLPHLQSNQVAVQEAAARALGEIGSLESTRDLLPLLETPSEPIRLAVARALMRLSHLSGQKGLRVLLEQGSDQAKIEAAVALMEFGDLSGAELLHRITSRSSATDARVLSIVSGLAKAGDVEARHQLSQQVAASVGSPHGPQLAFALARVGERSARIQLEELAVKSGPAQLLSARLLAGLGDTHGFPLLLETACSGEKTEPERAIAIDGLADLSKIEATVPLTKLLGEHGISSRLRLLAAGAILELVAGERAQLAEQSLAWARTALGSDSASTRELAASLLGEMESQSTIAPLAQALKDREREVRRSAARALGKKRAREALAALTDALDDTDDEVRAIGARSIGSIAIALKAKGGNSDKEADRQVIGRLQRLAQSRSEQDRVVAAGTLLQMGDRSQRSVIEVSLLSSNPLVRRLAIEMIDSDSRELLKALSDSDRLVRFAAARRLAAKGVPQATPILREVVSAGDMEGLTAYGILKRLGEAVEQPPGLRSLLTTGSLSERFAIMDILDTLPPPLAYQLLLVAANDPASVIRRRGADSASRFFLQTKQLVFIRLLRVMINDPEAAVRSRARELLAAVPADQESHAADTMESNELRPAPSVPVGASNVKQGQLLLVGEEGVRVQLDKLPWYGISNKPLAVSVGNHSITYLGGQQEFSVAAGETVTLKVPTTIAEQLIQDALDALKSRELMRAQGYLDRSRRLMQRVGIKPIVKGDHIYVQAKVNEQKNLLQQAATEYLNYQRLSPTQQRPEYLADAKSTLNRLALRMGRIQIFTMRDGTCQLAEEYYLPPGDQVISLGPGQTKRISVYAGITTPVRVCQ